MKAAEKEIKLYYKRIKEAQKELTKKELFKDLLHRLYSGEKEIEKIIDAISAGAETTIVNIPRKDRLHKGSADTLYNKIIIEFENDLKGSLKHAKEQLAGYLLGQFNSGEGYNYTLIVSDFINWKVVSPDVSQLDKLDSLKEDELILNEVPSASFTLTENNADDFYYWIDRFLFKEEKQKATLKRIEEAFGYNSSTFIESFRQISTVFQEAKKYGEVQVSYEQWRKFLSIAYGSFADSDSAFVIHTYLSVLAKVLAYEVLSNDDYIEDEEMKAILSGSIFHKYNISNFVDNDFFHWVYKDKYFRELKKVFRLVAQETSTFDFNQVDEDVLKGVYQELIDLDTRHALGEYYTPDWLCERIVQEFNFKPTDRILDPSCGSGSFLRAAIHRLRELNPKITVDEVNSCIYGIDIHPLSVQIAKTTMLVSLGKEVIKANKPIHINIILANTLLAPDGVQDLFGKTFKMSIDKEKLVLTSQILDDIKLFDDALEVCEDLAEQTQNKKSESIKALEKALKRKHRNGGLTPQIIEGFYKIYEGFKKVKEQGRDGIWKFIVQNLYKPYFLSSKFDYVVGNPPWFTFNSIKNEEYQDILQALAEQYYVKPLKTANMPQMEIAAIFLAYCTNYFLNKTGKLAFVLPRSFFSADHHDNTRGGKIKGLKLIKIWDMDKVTPLFRVPSGVLFAEKVGYGSPRQIPVSGLIGESFSGTLPAHNCNLNSTKGKLIEEDVTWFYAKQGSSSALTTRKFKNQNKSNPYHNLFKNGATVYPRPFYFVELNQETPPDWKERIINLKTSDSIKPDAKLPWKDLDFKDKIESQFLFRTILAKSVLPFTIHNPNLTVLPLLVNIDNRGKKTTHLTNSVELRKEGFLQASKWFEKVENIWNIHKTQKNKNITVENYLNWQNKLLNQDLNQDYIVLYNVSGKDAYATCLRRKDYDLELFFDYSTFGFYPKDINEGYYLTAILNSSIPNKLMKDFQAKGLFGVRHVSKKILDIYFPKFDENDKKHIQLSDLSRIAHEKGKLYLKGNLPKEQLTTILLGRYRVALKKHLAKEMEQIDELVSKVIK